MPTTNRIRVRSCRTGAVREVLWSDLEEAIRNGSVDPDDAIDFSAGQNDWRRAADSRIWQRLHDAAGGEGARVEPHAAAAPLEQARAAATAIAPRDRRPIVLRPASARNALREPVLAMPGVLSAIGVFGVLLYAALMPIAPAAHKDVIADLMKRSSAAAGGVLVMCLLALVEHHARARERPRGLAFYAGPLGVAAYCVAALVVAWLVGQCLGIAMHGGSDEATGWAILGCSVLAMLVFGALTVVSVAVGISLGVIAYRAGARAWGLLSVLFPVVVFLWLNVCAGFMGRQ